MKKWLASCLLLIFCSVAISQENIDGDIIPFITLEEAIELPADSVLHLDLTKLKLDSLPIEILKYKNLKSLDLGRNKLTSLPMWLNQLPLTYLDINRNKFDGTPIVICSLIELRVLKASRNKLYKLPTCISNLQKLETLDLFDTHLEGLPKEVLAMKQLNFIDLRGQTYAPSYLVFWDTEMPWANIEFDPPCNCLEK